MKNPDEKVNIEAFRDAKKLHLAGGLLTYLYIINRPYHGVAYVASVSVQFWKKTMRNKSQRVLLRVSLGICVSQVEERISLVICVPLLGKHISLVICVPSPGKHTSLVKCVHLPRKHISLVMCVPPLGKHISLVIYVPLRGKHISLVVCLPPPPPR